MDILSIHFYKTISTGYYVLKRMKRDLKNKQLAKIRCIENVFKHQGIFNLEFGLTHAQIICRSTAYEDNKTLIFPEFQID